MSAVLRALLSKSTEGYTVRRESHDGRQFLVVPTVAMVEGVIYAANAENPEMVYAEEFAPTLDQWDGQPLFYGHPQQAGRPVSGKTPEILNNQCIGFTKNASRDGVKFPMEAWIDEELGRIRAAELIARIEAGEPIENSVGVFADTDDTEGEHGGKKYKGAWRNIVPDHYALLQPNVEGACSRKAGCGVRAAQEGDPPVPVWYSRMVKTACGCRKAAPNGEVDMTILDRLKALAAKGCFPEAEIKALEGLTDEGLKVLEAAAERQAKALKDAQTTATEADLKAAEKRGAEAKETEMKTAAANAVPKTAAEYVAAAPAEIAAVLTGALKAAENRKAATIKVLQDSGRCDLSAQLLTAKSQDELDALVKLAGLKPAQDAAVDYSGQGTVRTEPKTAAAPAPPSLIDAVVEANKK